MNQDTLREALERIRPSGPFQLIFSGKRSMKHPGHYHPGTREIIIHNRNYDTEAGLVMAALDQYAHHIDHLERGRTDSYGAYQAIRSQLIEEAREAGLLVLDTGAVDARMATLKEAIKAHADLERRIGRELLGLEQECRGAGLPFEVITEHDLKLSRKSVKRFRGVAQLELFADQETLGTLSADQLSVVAAKKPSRREETLAFVADAPTVAIAAQVVKSIGTKPPRDPESPLEITKEIKRIEKTVTSLLDRKEHLEERLVTMTTPAEEPPARPDAGKILTFDRRTTEAIQEAGP